MPYEKILKLLKQSSEPLNHREIAEEVGKGKDYTSGYLDALHKLGKIGHKLMGKTKIYFLKK